MAKRPSYLRLFLTREREREGEGRRSGWRRHTALHPRRMQVLLQRENKRNGREGEGVGKKRVEENDSFYHYATRSRVYFLPFLNESVCVCVCVYRNGVRLFRRGSSSAPSSGNRKLRGEKERRGAAWCMAGCRGRGSRIRVGLHQS